MSVAYFSEFCLVVYRQSVRALALYFVEECFSKAEA